MQCILEMSRIFRYAWNMKREIKKQYNNFSTTYSDNINYDEASNSLFYEQLGFDLKDIAMVPIGAFLGIIVVLQGAGILGALLLGERSEKFLPGIGSVLGKLIPEVFGIVTGYGNSLLMGRRSGGSCLEFLSER